jgi:hypothetical protein
LNVTLTEFPHQGRAVPRGTRREQQVDVIGHQAICVHRTREFLGQLAQVKEIQQAIAVRDKASGSIVAALDEVNSYMGKHQARLSWHKRKTVLRCLG